jgi:AraC-like DNA-binding protein
VIIRHLQDGEPQRPKTATILGMSERTLQRRLAEEGTSFQRLLDDTRRELAQHYLGQSNISLTDITYLLGFSDQSSFFRAARRWFGNSPRDYRIWLISEESGRS